MNVTEARARLIKAALAMADTSEGGALRLGAEQVLCNAAVDYGKAKVKARNNRDRWKARKRITNG